MEQLVKTEKVMHTHWLNCQAVKLAKHEKWVDGFRMARWKVDPKKFYRVHGSYHKACDWTRRRHFYKMGPRADVTMHESCC